MQCQVRFLHALQLKLQVGPVGFDVAKLLVFWGTDINDTDHDGVDFLAGYICSVLILLDVRRAANTPERYTWFTDYVEFVTWQMHFLSHCQQTKEVGQGPLWRSSMITGKQTWNHLANTKCLGHCSTIALAVLATGHISLVIKPWIQR